MEFDKFLEIEGCKQGSHKFVEKINTEENVQCRHDWYQQSASIIVSVYAKKVKKEESKIEFESNALRVFIKFEDGKTFSRVYNLADVIDPAKSSFEFLTTKLEIKLVKANGKQWPDFERK